jgi:glucose-6-phosphate isomerase
MSGEPPQFFSHLAAVRSAFRRNQKTGFRELFAADPQRADDFTVGCGHLFVDFSKQFVSRPVITELIAMADNRGLPALIASMMKGDVINDTEQRAVLHTALRDFSRQSPESQQASEALQKATTLATQLRNAHFTDVVNIGIGGSDLGPLMAYRALRRYQSGPHVHFVSNVDPVDLDAVLDTCDPSTTLFVVVSKTFTTAETMRNARRARNWLISAGIKNPEQHFVACTSETKVATQWGIDPLHILEFWPWVGGRFSLSSTAGFALMMGVGAENFTEMLKGMHAMDSQFAQTPLEQNLPVLHGLIAFMNASIAEYASVAVVPYNNDLSRFPAFLQQLIMESNGKSVMSDGSPTILPTAPVVWGESGTNGQHAFFQLLHQGTQVIPVDFIGVADTSGTDADAHDELVANLFAQSRALAFGRTREEVMSRGSSEELVPHRVFEGNRPSTTIMLTALEPQALGELIALYEHSTAVQGWMMGVNSFDQLGVELGKTLASEVLDTLQKGGGVSQFDASTNALLQWYLTHRHIDDM